MSTQRQADMAVVLDDFAASREAVSNLGAMPHDVVGSPSICRGRCGRVRMFRS
jgi:hypothetical protein